MADFRLHDASLGVSGLALRIQSVPSTHIGPAQPVPSPPFEGFPGLDLFVQRTESGALATRGRLVFDSGGVWRLFDDGGCFRFELASPVLGPTPYKVVTIDRSWSSGTILLNADVLPADADPLEYPLDELLFMHLLARHGGVELHAFGLEHEGYGYLFVGHSGAGKSTTAKLWLDAMPRTTVLSDDRIIVRPRDGRLHIWGTPWHGEALLSSPASAPVRKIFVLRQAPSTTIRRLPSALAAAELMSRSFVPVYDGEAVARAMETVSAVVAEVPVYDFAFTPDRDAIEAALRC